MDDLISRDFIKSLGGECIAARDSKTHELLPISSIDALPSAQPEPQWIPCSERLPEEDGDYWVTVDPRYVPPQYKSTDIILWSNGKWMMADYFVIDGEGRKMPEYKAVEVDIPIIAWMPLPEPWRGEEHED